MPATSAETPTGRPNRIHPDTTASKTLPLNLDVMSSTFLMLGVLDAKGNFSLKLNLAGIKGNNAAIGLEVWWGSGVVNTQGAFYVFSNPMSMRLVK